MISLKENLTNDKIPNYSVRIVLGDFNAQIGWEDENNCRHRKFAPRKQR